MKFRIKVTLCMLSIISIFFGIGGTALIYTTFDSSIKREQYVARKSYNMILNTLTLLNNSSSWSSQDEVADIIEQITSQEDTFSAIKLYSDSGTIYSKGESISLFEDLTSHTDSTHVSYKTINADDQYFFQLCGTFKIGVTQMYLDVAYDVSSIYKLRTEQEKAYMSIFCILILLCAIFSYILSYFLTRPLSHLAATARDISAGDHEKRSNITSKDEVGILSREFNNMADSLIAAMERQNQFIGDFTHELKTPMTSIIGYADLLRRHTLTSEDTDDAANYIFQEGKRLERLSIKMLDLIVAENSDVKLTAASPCDLIENITSHLKDSYKEQGISLATECEPGQCMLEPDYFTSLIINLLENSRRAIINKNTQKFETSHKDIDSTTNNSWARRNIAENIYDTVKLTSTMSDKGCTIIITDTGCGIPKDSLTHITEAFYRVDKARSRAHGGAGLGLSLCAQIVKLHQGSLSIESEVNKGTTIKIELKGGRI